MNSTIFPSVFKTIDGTLQACNLVSVDLMLFVVGFYLGMFLYCKQRGTLSEQLVVNRPQIRARDCFQHFVGAFSIAWHFFNIVFEY